MQLEFTDWWPKKAGSFGARACRALRRRILAGQLDTLPKSWQRPWIIQRIIATPPWADMADIRAIYRRAECLSYETGVAHDVDHIIPLTHPRVCGLHVSWNLRPLPAGVNNAKSNRWCPEQLSLFEEPHDLPV